MIQLAIAALLVTLQFGCTPLDKSDMGDQTMTGVLNEARDDHLDRQPAPDLTIEGIDVPIATVGA